LKSDIYLKLEWLYLNLMGMINKMKLIK
jgi:hypothetical protein